MLRTTAHSYYEINQNSLAMTMIEAGWDTRSRITSYAVERQEEPQGLPVNLYVRRGQMNPVIGLDISKEESHGQAFLDRGKPFKGSFQFEHMREGLLKLDVSFVE